MRPRTIDWGGALGLVEVAPGATLAFDNIISAFPGNFTMGEEVMTLKNNGSFVWPTVVLLPNSTVSFTACMAAGTHTTAWMVLLIDGAVVLRSPSHMHGGLVGTAAAAGATLPFCCLMPSLALLPRPTCADPLY